MKNKIILLFTTLILIFTLSSCKTDDEKTDDVMNVTYTSYKIMEGTSYETTVYEINSGIDGPKGAIISGVHGNERGGILALEQIKSEMIAGTYSFKGSVIIITEANKLACTLMQRQPAPTGDDYFDSSDDLDNDASDAYNLNRQFPGKSDGTLIEKLAYSIVSRIEAFGATYFIDLHESQYLHGTESVSNGGLGESIISGNQTSSAASETILNTYNSNNSGTDFVYISPPVTGTFAYYFSGLYYSENVKNNTSSYNYTESQLTLMKNYQRKVAYTVETTNKNKNSQANEASRSKHYNMVRTILDYVLS